MHERHLSWSRQPMAAARLASGNLGMGLGAWGHAEEETKQNHRRITHHASIDYYLLQTTRRMLEIDSKFKRLILRIKHISQEIINLSIIFLSSTVSPERREGR